MRKFEVSGLSEDRLQEFAGCLSLVGVTLDEYRTIAAPGPKEIALSAMGPDWPLSLQMPYGLVRNETPIFLSRALMATAQNTPTTPQSPQRHRRTTASQL